jgi:hypothetical protein
VQTGALPLLASLSPNEYKVAMLAPVICIIAFAGIAEKSTRY